MQSTTRSSLASRCRSTVCCCTNSGREKGQARKCNSITRVSVRLGCISAKCFDAGRFYLLFTCFLSCHEKSSHPLWQPTRWRPAWDGRSGVSPCAERVAGMRPMSRRSPDFSPCGTLQPPACCSSAVGLSSPGPPPQTSSLTNPHEPSCKSKSTPQLSTELAGLSGTEQNFPAGSWYHPPLSSLIFQLMTHGKP